MDEQVEGDDAAGCDPLLAAIDAERQRLAREFHDGLGQALTGALLLSSAAGLERNEALAARLSNLLDEAAARLRGLNHCLDPGLTGRALRDLLEHLADDLRQRFQLPVTLPTALPEEALPAATCHHLHHAIIDGARFAMLHKGMSMLVLTVGEDDPERMEIALTGRAAEGMRMALAADGDPCLHLVHRRLARLRGEAILERASASLTLRLRWPRAQEVA